VELDVALAQDRRAQEWTRRHMPLLTASIDASAAAPASRRLAVCLHLEPKTAVLLGLLAARGVTITATGSPGTTQDATVAGLRAAGVTVFGSRSDDEPQHRRNVEQVLDCDPHLILDNGADLCRGWLRRPGAGRALIGATEETTTGAAALRALPEPPPFPVVVINESPLKLLVENEHGVGHTIVQGFLNATNLMLPGTRAVVVGYGPCGKGVATTLARLGARVAVADPDPYRALEAFLQGHRVGPLPELLRERSIVFLATGRPGVIGTSELAAAADGTILAGVGHFPVEVDAEALAEESERTEELGIRGIERTVHHLRDGRQVVILDRTRMINLTAALGNPIEAMDLGLTLQVRSLAELATGALQPQVQSVPAHLDKTSQPPFSKP